MIDNDTIQAEENKRRESEVRGGRSAIETKYEESPYKDLQIKLAQDNPNMAVAEEFRELTTNDPKPGFNFVAPSRASTADEIKTKNREFNQAAKEEEKNMLELQKEGKENELKVTRTSTGQPKVDESGNVVVPLQSDSDENENPAAHPSESNTIKGSSDSDKSGSKSNISPAGSGDVNSLGAVKK